MAFQMLAILVVFVFIGYKADAYFKNETAYCTAIFSLIGVIASIYTVLKDFIFPKK